MEFPTKEMAMRCIKEYHMNKAPYFVVEHSDTARWIVHCSNENCIWRCIVILSKKSQNCMVHILVHHQWFHKITNNSPQLSFAKASYNLSSNDHCTYTIEIHIYYYLHESMDCKTKCYRDDIQKMGGFIQGTSKVVHCFPNLSYKNYY
jgi:hypothetical protein